MFFITQEDHMTLAFKVIKLLGLGSVEVVQALDRDLLGVYTGKGIGK